MFSFPVKTLKYVRSHQSFSCHHTTDWGKLFCSHLSIQSRLWNFPMVHDHWCAVQRRQDQLQIIIKAGNV